MNKCLVAVFAGMAICGACRSMWNGDSDINTTAQMIRDQFAPVVKSFSFDKENFMSQLNPKVSEQMKKLLDDSFEKGSDASLEYCSERIHAGLLHNQSVFKKNVDIGDRDRMIYEISLEVLRRSVDSLLPVESSINALKNILVYCKSEATDIGLSKMREIVSSIFLQIQYRDSLGSCL